MNRFRVTFETVTPESAEHGDAATRGFVNRFGDRVELEAVDLEEVAFDGRPLFFMTLREALERARDLDELQGLDPSDSWVEAARWFSFYGERDHVSESVSIHFPETATPSTRRRLCGLLS